MRLLALVGLVATLPCQASPDRILVLVHQQGQPASVIYEVDRLTGVSVPLPGFPSDTLPPLAIAIDPATREPIVALAAGPGSVLMRIHIAGQQVLGESALAALPDTVVGMCFPSISDLIVATDGPTGGILRVERQRGGVTTFWSAPGISALSEPVILPGKFWAAQDQSPGAAVLNAFLDTSPGGPVVTTPLSAQVPGTRVTGIHEYLSGGRVQVFSDTLGNVYGMQSFPHTWMFVQLQPAIAAGGAVRLKGGPDNQVLVLGGSVDPTLKSFPQIPPQMVRPVTVIATFVGNPVDFAVVASASARSVRFGAPCTNPPGGSASTVGVPQLGNPSFAVRLDNGLSNTYALFAAGGSERAWLGIPLPLSLGTCDLLVSPDVLLVQLTDPLGVAVQPLPVPASPSLSGAIL
ncbi:MAG TPA: hypothetical protein VFT55_03525, partial [Planctomycetota bacterium]|nr:hypothetical protein [Planctomycetota bacterium]